MKDKFARIVLYELDEIKKQVKEANLRADRAEERAISMKSKLTEIELELHSMRVDYEAICFFLERIANKLG